MVLLVDDDVLGAAKFGFLANAFEFDALAEIGGIADDLAAIVFAEPGEDDGSVEAAAVGEEDSFDL